MHNLILATYLGTDKDAAESMIASMIDVAVFPLLPSSL